MILRTARLSVRPALVSGEALDSFLERVCVANHIPTPELEAGIRRLGGTIPYLIHTPTPATLKLLGTWAGVSPQELRDATLARHDGIAYALTGLDPHRATSFRAVSARGWVPGRATQLCPVCLAEDGVWRLSWRLPTSTICVHHRTYMARACTGCGLAFREHRHSFLRPDPGITCNRSYGEVPRRRCDQDLRAIPLQPATDACLTRQGHHDRVLAGDCPATWAYNTPGEYFAEIKALTTLLLHLAGQPDSPGLVPWGTALSGQTRPTPSSARGPRWGVAPPTDPAVRSQALAAADHILTIDDFDTAVARFRPWYDLTPNTTDGRLGWLADHTRMTPALTRLVMATHAPRRRLSARLDAGPPVVPLQAIPQAVPHHLYTAHIGDLMGCGPDTGRLFVSLALARTHTSVQTWEAAATALGLPPELGPATAHAVHARTITTPEQLHHAITALAQDLDPAVSWRVKEHTIIRAAATPAEWLPAWAAEHHPTMRHTSAPYAVTWRWIHEAGGVLHASPAWAAPPTRQQRAAYRQFATLVRAPAKP